MYYKLHINYVHLVAQKKKKKKKMNLMPPSKLKLKIRNVGKRRLLKPTILM